MVANSKQLSQERQYIRDLFLAYNRIPIVSVPLLLTMMKLADLKEWTDSRIHVLRLNISELDLTSI